MPPRTKPTGAWVLAVFLSAGAAEPSRAQYNAGFELGLGAGRVLPAGWRVDEDDGVERDTTVVYAGAHSLRVTQAERRTVRVTQTLTREAIAGDRILLSGYLKTEDVVNGYAGLWLRVAGADDALYFDSMRDRGVVGSTQWALYEIAAPFPPEAKAVHFGPILRGSGTAWFDELSLQGQETSRLPPASPVAASYLRRALDIMQANSLKRKRVDWPRFRAEIMQQARGATSEPDTYVALQYALRKLGDNHSFLMTPERTDAVSRETFANARTGSRSLEPRMELLGGAIAYLWMPGFSGGTHAHRRDFAANLQALIRELDGADPCGWIVDVRDNNGGNLWPMLAGIGPLLGEGDAGAAIYPDGRAVPVWYRDGQAGFGDFTQLRVAGDAYRLRAVDPPVAILTGRETASSGELIVTAFRGRLHTRTFGEGTRGVSSGNRTFPLSDGAQLILAVAATGDRTGKIYEGVIEPDVRIDEASGGGSLAEQPVVEAAMHWLRTQAACRMGAS